MGHSVGDVALVEIAAEIRKTFRSTDVVGRIGGDEFMVFCSDPIADGLVEVKARSICRRNNNEFLKKVLTNKKNRAILSHMRQ